MINIKNNGNRVNKTKKLEIDNIYQNRAENEIQKQIENLKDMIPKSIEEKLIGWNLKRRRREKENVVIK